MPEHIYRIRRTLNFTVGWQKKKKGIHDENTCYEFDSMVSDQSKDDEDVIIWLDETRIGVLGHKKQRWIWRKTGQSSRDNSLELVAC